MKAEQKGPTVVRRLYERIARIQFGGPLIHEEYRAELLIGKIRIGLFLFFLFDHTAAVLLLGDENTNSILTSLAGLVYAVLVFIDIRQFRKPPFNRYYSRLVKYMYITLDAAAYTYLVAALAQGITGTQFDLSIQSALPLAMFVLGVILLFIGILRFSWVSCMYTGAAYLCAAFIVQYYTLNYKDTGQMFHPDGNIRVSQLVLIYGIVLSSAFASLVSQRLRAIVTKSKRQEELERFLPDVVARQIVSGQTDLNTGGLRSTATILFSDIRNFTTMAEEESPEEVLAFLNSYFNDMIDIIFHYNGTLDKIIGDGIMAIYGAPIRQPDAPANAVRTAIDMIHKLNDFNALRVLQNKAPIQIGIGIHTGDVILGNVGSDKRMDFTAIGDTVNTAARLEALTREKNTPILISSSTRRQLNGDFQFQNLGMVSLKGKKTMLEVFSVSGNDSV
ncbi:MAG: adenylate/guanylate cyclase domain-containing protein [Leptospiraceae bacterium]|nr:adenylate/guanylate cyclase domain-containing protein [Leptospiraceae bacterium]MCB1315348.1 adenylate/guanylate cyclase domain-containing protein [Leptospiraceae bacterium]